MSQKSFYLTTTLPYVNSDPHVGFALEIIQADVIARYKKSQGYDVFFNTGTDEHGVKVYSKALEAKEDPQAYTDRYAERFRGLIKSLGLSEDIHFIRTTDTHHKKAAQEFWQKCVAAGDIYKKNYKVKYCIGCELEKTDSELVDGKCPIHPNLEIENREEENYFFAFSKYGQKLLDLYEKNPNFVVPAYRLNEITTLIKEKGLEDFSISRLKTKMPWGVAVPDDAEHVMYVWFDALVNYISTIGWPEKLDTFNKYWPVTQFAGKDQVRQQAAMWQAMLMSVGLAPSEQIVIHGFIQSGGQKMSKSLGNVIDPYKVVEEYSIDALRYYLLREVSPFEDSDFTMDKFKDAYNANLANGLGNLVSRVMKMAVSYDVSFDNLPTTTNNLAQSVSKYVEAFEFNKAMTEIWAFSTSLDEFIQKEQPFKKVKVDATAAHADIRQLLSGLTLIAQVLQPFMPTTAVAIAQCIAQKQVPEKPLFARKD
jgi:methionyl-tRNA synthetase